MLRDILHLQATMYYLVYYTDILIKTFWVIFQGFATTYRKLSKIVWMIVNIFQNLWRLPRISKDLRKLLKKIQKCFDHTTNLNMMLVKSSISSLVKICKIRHPSPCVIIILFKFWVEYFPVKHLLLYKYYKLFHWY